MSRKVHSSNPSIPFKHFSETLSPQLTNALNIILNLNTNRNELFALLLIDDRQCDAQSLIEATWRHSVEIARHSTIKISFDVDSSTRSGLLFASLDALFKRCVKDARVRRKRRRRQSFNPNVGESIKLTLKHHHAHTLSRIMSRDFLSIDKLQFQGRASQQSQLLREWNSQRECIGVSWTLSTCWLSNLSSDSTLFHCVAWIKEINRSYELISMLSPWFADAECHQLFSTLRPASVFWVFRKYFRLSFWKNRKSKSWFEQFIKFLYTGDRRVPFKIINTPTGSAQKIQSLARLTRETKNKKLASFNYFRALKLFNAISMFCQANKEVFAKLPNIMSYVAHVEARIAYI